MTRRTYVEIKTEDILKALGDRDKRIAELEQELAKWKAENAKLKAELLRD